MTSPRRSKAASGGGIGWPKRTSRTWSSSRIGTPYWSASAHNARRRSALITAPVGFQCLDQAVELNASSIEGNANHASAGSLKDLQRAGPGRYFRDHPVARL